MMRIGYGRVSTRDQNPEAQHDALKAAGCDEVFIDKASGKLARPPELERALLSANRAGDQLVVTKLDRLGRSLEHVIELREPQPVVLAAALLDQLAVRVIEEEHAVELFARRAAVVTAVSRRLLIG
jgi:hypothetical protein